MSAAIENATEYVGTTKRSGAAQLALLTIEGMTPESRVLEFGCGTLHLARLLLPFLDTGHYYGVDPNKWLRDIAAADDPDLMNLIESRGAHFSEDADFDARSFHVRFDYVFAHSVLSHAAHWQLPQFLHGALRVLNKGGKIIASLRLGTDTWDDDWVYPSVSWFSTSQVAAVARELGLRVFFGDGYKKLYTSMCPDEVHDWIVLERA